MSLDLYLIPDACPHCGRGGGYVFDRNITHNLTRMWDKAGVYDALYMGDGKRASDVVEAVRAGVAAMKADPPTYQGLNASNGWGTYEHALPFLEAFLAACEENPSAVIRVSK